MPAEKPAPIPPPTFREALRFWVKLGFISFGGPAGQLAIMHRELVEARRWISEGHFLHALNFCMLLPGPEAQQLATYLGWRLHGARGGIAAGTLFVLPSVFILYALSWLYVLGAEVPPLAAVFHGLLPAVIAIVAAALVRIARRALRTPAHWTLAAVSFVAIFGFDVSFVAIVAAVALISALGHGLAPALFPAGKGHGSHETEDGLGCAELPPAPRASWRRVPGVIALCGVLWWAPVFAVGAWQGWGGTLFAEGVFFSKAALVTFGGAYAVLPYVAQQAVEHYGWLTHSQMMSGLAFAETTPGPLIMVLQFVGFLGGWQQHGALAPWAAATLGALLTTWVTFLPCFLFIFLGGPHVEQLRDQPRLGAALAGITAAVVGVILNLTVWFAWHALWPTGWMEGRVAGGLDGFVAIGSVLAFVAIERGKVNEMWVIGAGALLGLLWRWIGGA